MCNQPKISVICPVYNGEKFLNDLIESLMNQSFKEFEVIFINDGSTDDSINIINSYCVLDKRFVVYNIKNSGQAKAKNFGISKAIGHYLCFIDNDDFVKDTWLESLYSAISRECQLAICDFVRTDEAGNIIVIKEKTYPKQGFYSNEQIMNLLLSSRIHGLAWNKIYVNKIIKDNNIQFYDDRVAIMDDLYFNFCYLNYISKCFIVNSKEIFYRQRISSTSKGISSRNIGDLYIRKLIISKNYTKYVTQHLQVSNIISIMNFIKASYHSGDNDLHYQFIEFFKKEKPISLQIFFDLNLKNKMKYFLLCLNINLFLKL